MNLQIDFDFYILWQLNNASFVQMCCCGCKVIFYNSIIHVSTFGFSKPPTQKKVQQQMKRTKTFQLSCNFHGQWLWFALKNPREKCIWKAGVRESFQNQIKALLDFLRRKSDLWDHECPFRFAYEANISIIHRGFCNSMTSH